MPSITVKIEWNERPLLSWPSMNETTVKTALDELYSGSNYTKNIFTVTEVDSGFREWAEKEMPDIVKRYDAWAKIGFELKPGQLVESIRSGFGSIYGGVRMQYLGRDDKYPKQLNLGYAEGKRPIWGLHEDRVFDSIVPIFDVGE